MLLILLSEPHGQGAAVHRRLAAVPAARARSSGRLGGVEVGLVEPIPYQPIGGLKRARGGFASPDVPAPLGIVDERAHRSRGVLPDAEPDADRRGAAARRLGPRRADDPARDGGATRRGLLGLGFREYRAKTCDSRWKRWPPVPASQPNYVGIDGVLEGLCPPYVTDMDAAVDQVLEEKFGPGGTYADAEVFAQAYRDRATPRRTSARRPPRPPEAIAYTKEICRYLVETYGRFPAHTDAFHLPGIWVQFSHLEIEYYERFASPAATSAAQAEGREIWDRR